LQKDIARHLHCHPKTVQRYLQRTLPLPARATARTSKLDRYKPYLLQRWNAGCHNASQLFRELQPRGFDGGCTVLRAFVAKLREQSGMPARSRTARGRPLVAADMQQVPSSRTLAWLSTHPKTALDEQQQVFQAKRATVNTTLATAVELAQRFTTMVRERQASALEGWLDDATECGIAAVRSFANGIRTDADAVRAALSVSWSNGRTEGSVNRLKCVKRQMYGRGKLDLLRLRLIAT
jgi:transposase